MNVSIEPCSDQAMCYVNGRQILERVPLRTGSRIILGRHHVFRFINPMQARSEQQKQRGGATTPLAAETPAGSGGGGAVDWTFAQNELLNKQGIDLKAEMDKRIMAMEEELQRQKQQAERAITDQKREYEARIDLLQRQVNTQSLIMSQSMASLADLQQYDNMYMGGEMPASTHRLSVKSSIAAPFGGGSTAATPTTGNAALFYSPIDTDEQLELASRFALQWRCYRFSSIRNALWSNAPLLKEANAVSVELGRNLRFQFELLRNTPYTPLPDEFQHMVQVSLKRFAHKNDFFESSSHSATAAGQQQRNVLSSRLHSSSTVLAVRVYDLNNFGTLVYWSLNRLRQRLTAMKQIYEREVDATERRARRWQLNSLGGSSEPESKSQTG